jgi:hypothetical protein
MSKPTCERGTDDVRVSALLSFLSKLAKANRVAVFALAGDGRREVVVTGSSATGNSSMAGVSYAVFADARDRGWLTDLDGGGERWGLSAEGRVALRRARSAGTQSACGGDMSIAETANRRARVDAGESPLGWLRRRKDKNGQPLISAQQYDAGERLRADLWFAQMTPRTTVNWSASGGSSRAGGGLGIDVRDGAADAQGRVRRALAAVGSMQAGVLIDVCGHLKGLENVERDLGLPPRSGKVVLQMALTDLARHYGLPGADRGQRHVAAKLRHWGVDDFRPTIASEER